MLLKDSSKIYIGNSVVSAIYVNQNKVWPAGPVLWTPADLGSNLLAWLDARDAAMVTVTGSGVSQWADKSGNALHAIQAIDASRPTYASGRITFDGAQNLGLLGYPVNYDFIFVGRIRGNDYSGSYGWRVILQSSGHFPLLVNDNNELGTWGNSGFARAGALSWAGYTEGICYGTISNSAPSTLSRDGGAQFSTDAAVEQSQPLSIGRSDYTQPFGDIYELIFVPYESPLDTKQKLEGYVAWRWGLQGSLPMGHPYKNAAPITGV